MLCLFIAELRKNNNNFQSTTTYILNQMRSHINFTLQKDHCPAVNINQTIIPQTEAVKYLRLHFDCGLNWKEHIARKRKQVDLKIKKINWFI